MRGHVLAKMHYVFTGDEVYAPIKGRLYLSRNEAIWRCVEDMPNSDGCYSFELVHVPDGLGSRIHVGQIWRTYGIWFRGGKVNYITSFRLIKEIRP